MGLPCARGYAIIFRHGGIEQRNKEINRLGVAGKGTIVPHTTAHEFERLAASVFQVDGQYVERNLKTPEHQVTELDVVATDFHCPTPQRTVCECTTSQDCGVSELLKLKGKQILASADRAVMALRRPPDPDKLNILEEVARRLRVSLVIGEKYEELFKHLSSKGFVSRCDAGHAQHWMKFYRLEDALRDIVHTLGRQENSDILEREHIRQTREYLRTIEEKFWWKYPDIWERAVQSYRAHNRYRTLARDVATEYKAAGQERTPARHLLVTVQDGVCPPAQGALYVQTRARLAILAIACECSLEIAADERRKAVFEKRELNLSTASVLRLDQQNDNFRKMVGILSNEPELARLLPGVMQTWLGVWGAFSWIANTRNEYRQIASDFETQVSTVRECLRLMDMLFSVAPVFVGTQRGWFAEIPTGRNTEDWRIRTLKLVPEAFKGVGVIMRERLFPEKTKRQHDCWVQWRSHADSYISNLKRIECSDRKRITWPDFGPSIT